MSARVMSARGLRAFLLVSAVFFGSIASVNASDTVKLTFTGNVTQWNGVTPGVGSAGRYNWTFSNRVEGGGNANLANMFPGPDGSPAWTFCIQQNQYITGGGTYNYTVTDTANLTGLPQGTGTPPNYTISATQNQYLQALANLIGTTSFISSYTAPQTQQAIWAAIVGIDVSGGLSTASGIGYDIYQEYVALFVNFTKTQSYFFWGLKSEDNQDQIILTDGGGNGGGGSIVVPVPTGVVMAGMGVVFLGGFNLFRRSKKVTTA